MRLYLDSAPVIYTVEQVTPFATAVDERLAAQGIVLVASDLTRMECRLQPMREGDAELLRDFDDFFDQAVSQIVPLSREVIDLAPEIRAQHGFKTPDAIHLAAAVISGCDAFFTNDHQLDRFKGIATEVVES